MAQLQLRCRCFLFRLIWLWKQYLLQKRGHPFEGKKNYQDLNLRKNTNESCFHQLIPYFIKHQSCHHIETSQLICSANQLTGVCRIATLAFNELNTSWWSFIFSHCKTKNKMQQQAIFHVCLQNQQPKFQLHEISKKPSKYSKMFILVPLLDVGKLPAISDKYIDWYRQLYGIIKNPLWNGIFQMLLINHNWHAHCQLLHFLKVSISI